MQINFEIRSKHIDAGTNLQLSGSKIASLKESERCITKVQINDATYFTLTQSDVVPLEDGGFGLKGYGVWIFENEASEDNIIGKMINIADQEPQMEAKEGFEKPVFAILDIIREWLKVEYEQQQVVKEPTK